MLVGRLADLRKPDAVIVDYVRLPKLFPGEPWAGADRPSSSTAARRIDGLWAWRLGAPDGRPAAGRRRSRRARVLHRFVGRELEMNDHRAIIVGVCEATRTFQSNPVVYTTYSRAKQFVPRSGRSSRTSWPRPRTGRSHARGRRRRDPAADRPEGARPATKFIWDDDRVLLQVHRHPDQLRHHGVARASWSARRSPGRRSTTSRSRTSSSSARSRRWARPTCGSSA